MIIDSPIISGSQAVSGSLNQFGNAAITGSLTVSGSTFAAKNNVTLGTDSTNTVVINSTIDSNIVPYEGGARNLGSNAAKWDNIYANAFTGSLFGTSSFALTASYATNAGAGAGFPFSGSAQITGSLLITELSGSGVRYLTTDNTGLIVAQTASAAIKSTQAVTSTAGQTSFSITNGYTTGLVDVYINGSKLSAAEFTDTSGTVITLATGSNDGDTVEFVKYFPASGVTNNVLRQLTTFTASAGQTVFSASYTPGLLDIYYNGSRLSTSDYTANNGTYFTLATASVANDILDVLVYSYQVGAFSGIGGTGVVNQIAYFNTTSSITGSNNFTISGSTMTVTGSLLVTGSINIMSYSSSLPAAAIMVSGAISAISQESKFAYGTWTDFAPGTIYDAKFGGNQNGIAVKGTSFFSSSVLINKTTSTGGKLQVSNGTDMFNVDHDANGPYITAVNNANTVYKRMTYDASHHVFALSATEIMRISSSAVQVGGTYNRNALQSSQFGYSTSYRTLIIGSAGTSYTTDATSLAFNVDVSANNNGSFTGNGSEYIWRNVGSFITPNSGNTGYNTIMSWGSGGAVTFPNSIRSLGESLFYYGTYSDPGPGVAYDAKFGGTSGGGIAVRGNSVFVGSVSKGGGSFRIDHPLPEKKDTHFLLHSFIEGPTPDLIYRGVVTLVNGTATINIDEVSDMTEGTFVLLNKRVQCFTTNESGWDLTKGKVEGNILTITSQNPESTDEISWMVIGERNDEWMQNSDMTDENGKIIVEKEKPTITEEII